MVLRIRDRQSKILFCNEKLVDLFLLIPRAPLLRVCQGIDMNYVHALKLLKIWASLDLLVLNKAGHRYNIFYTEKGKRLAEQLDHLRRYMRRAKIQWCEDA
jgi:hypothetical protein